MAHSTKAGLCTLSSSLCGPYISKCQTAKLLFFFHIKKNVKLIKETNTFNETYVGHLEGEDLQRVCCETRRLMESVKSEDKDTRL